MEEGFLSIDLWFMLENHSYPVIILSYFDYIIIECFILL